VVVLFFSFFHFFFISFLGALRKLGGLVGDKHCRAARIDLAERLLCAVSFIHQATAQPSPSVCFNKLERQISPNS
jgi:hypothetical protein